MQGDIAVSGPTVTLSSLNSKEASTIKTTCEDINKTVYEMSSKTGIEDSDVKILSYTKDNEFSDGESGIVMNVRFNAWLYNRLNGDQRMEVMDIVLSGIEQSDLSSISKSRLYNIISNLDTIIIMIIFLMVMFSKDGRGLHDILAMTKVIDLKAKPALESEIIKPKKEEHNDE
jgi:hypothetical protein